VIFGDSDTEGDFSETLSEKTEHIDQENKIKLVNDLKAFGDKYRYSVLIINESLAPIYEVKIKVKYPTFLSLSRSAPPTVIINPSQENGEIMEDYKELTLKFEQINATDSKQINFYFNPLKSKQEGYIKTFMTFINADDFVRILNSDPISVKTNPISIEPKIVPSNYLSEFIKTPSIKKAIKSVGIDGKKDFDPDFYFNQIEVIIRINNFQKIAKDEEKKICWYFGKHIDTKQEIMVIGQVNQNKVEWIASSENPYILIPLLTYFLEDLKTRLLRMDIIQSSDKIYDLSCKNCGFVLSKFPKKGEMIECSNCRLEQRIW
jgi:hypothetical protein